MLPAQRRHCASAPSSLPSEPEAPPFEPLHFDSSFESGNLAEAKLIAELPLEYDLYIRPDTLNARHRVWFFFSVSNARKNQKALFNLIGYSKTKSLFRDGMAPVVSSSRRPYWERMPQSAVYYYRSPRHDRQAAARSGPLPFRSNSIPRAFGPLLQLLFLLPSHPGALPSNPPSYHPTLLPSHPPNSLPSNPSTLKLTRSPLADSVYPVLPLLLRARRRDLLFRLFVPVHVFLPAGTRYIP